MPPSNDSPSSDSSDWILLTPDTLNPAAAIAFVTHPSAGGIDIFIGTTRSQPDGVKGPLEALDYEAYPEMAQRQMAALVAHARAHWPICKCALLHRIGRVPVGHASVLVAVSCPHRQQAFDACRYLIDALKVDAAIWKKDIRPHAQHWHHDPSAG